MLIKCKRCENIFPKEYSSEYQKCPKCDWEFSHQDNYEKSNHDDYDDRDDDYDDKKANKEYYKKQEADEEYEEYRRYGGENPLRKSENYFSSAYNYIHGKIKPY